MSKSFSRMAVAGLILTLAACGDIGGPSLGKGEGLLVLSVASGTPAAGPEAASETITVGSDVLVIEQVELVLRRIELERAGEDDACPAGDSGNDSGENPGDDDGCEKVNAGPLLVELPLGGETTKQLQVAVDSGTFEEVEFEIHRPDDDKAADGAFLAAHTDFARVSIRVRGTFNGAPFVFTSDLDVEQEMELSPPLVVVAGGTAGLTLIVDVRSWFLDSALSRLVDPNTALKGQANEGLVKENIKRSIDAESDHEGQEGEG